MAILAILSARSSGHLFTIGVISPTFIHLHQFLANVYVLDILRVFCKPLVTLVALLLL